MTEEKTETHVIKRRTGSITVEVTYTPRTGRQLRLYRLVISVKEAVGCSPYVFVYRRATEGAPMEDGSPRDEFMCVADQLDEDEIPVVKPDVEHGVPYYRVKSVELLFRASDMMYETAREIMTSLRET